MEWLSVCIALLLNTVRAMLLQAHLTPQFWVEALNAASYVLNRIPHASIGFNVPFQMLFNRNVDVATIRVFGCLCYAHITRPIPHKLAPRARRCVFLGYGVNMKGYICYDIDNGQVYTSRHVTFVEDIFPYQVPSTTNTMETPPKSRLGSFTNPMTLDTCQTLPPPTFSPPTYLKASSNPTKTHL